MRVFAATHFLQQDLEAMANRVARTKPSYLVIAALIVVAGLSALSHHTHVMTKSTIKHCCTQCAPPCDRCTD